MKNVCSFESWIIAKAVLIAVIMTKSAMAQTAPAIDAKKAAKLFAEAQQAAASYKPAVTSAPARLLLQYHEAQNHGNVAAVMSLFHDDATFVAAPMCLSTCTGKAQIEKAIEGRVRDYNQQNLIDVQTNGNVATSRTDWRSDATRNADVERRINIETVEVRDGKIVRYTTSADLSDPQTAKFQAFIAARAAKAKAASEAPSQK